MTASCHTRAGVPGTAALSGQPAWALGLCSGWFFVMCLWDHNFHRGKTLGWKSSLVPLTFKAGATSACLRLLDFSVPTKCECN